MRGGKKAKWGLGLAMASGVVVATAVVSCGLAPTAFIVQGPGSVGNEPPALRILEPNEHITKGQGDPFLIRWIDSDRDDNATIVFTLESTTSSDSISLVEGIDENDSIGPDLYRVPTTLITPGTYNVLGTIDDGVNPSVESFAMVAGQVTPQRVVVTIVGPGAGPQTVPPRVAVTAPTFPLSVAQDDTLEISVQPTMALPGANIPFDPDSDVHLYVLLDVDLDPNNDDPANPDSSQIIVLHDQTVPAGTFEAITVPIRIDLSSIPARPSGDPYFIRATVTDVTNPPVHSYAVGTISVVQLAADTVDLFEIGRTKSGALFKGFNPAANLGSHITTVSDFDDDGVEDFVMVAQYGNPQNVGPVGEAYLVYGQGRVQESGLVLPGNRFGGSISTNSISDTISGVIFQAPPVRNAMIPDAQAHTHGITDASWVPDLTGDGRPELLFGLPHVHGAYESTDYDPGDSEPTDRSQFGCYPDGLVNNLATDLGRPAFPDIVFYVGGMVVMVNSSNRDNDPRRDPVPSRLDTTAISLEYVGQWPGTMLDGEGGSSSGFIRPRADDNGVTNRGTDPEEAGRIAGARFIAGGYDFIEKVFLDGEQPTRAGLWGQTVRSLGDLTADGVPELIISAPRNEVYMQELDGFFFPTQLFSTTFPASITVLPGSNYNLRAWRDINGEEGTSITPPIDHFRWPTGTCTGTPLVPRRLLIPSEQFGIFAEAIDDELGDGQSAGDFNQDGVDDILCGAPGNDLLNSLRDTGAVYIIYGRTTFGEVNLIKADSTRERPPMLRVRGLSPNDQIGWAQTAGLDVNGDRIDDVFISSPQVDFGGITRASCAGDLDRDGSVDHFDLELRSFNNCVAQFGVEVFTTDACKVFDYDNDGDIDDDDRCVFCCLSNDCTPAMSCILGRGAQCCEDVVDNGFVGIIFGGVGINGDRDLNQLATSQLPGVSFYGGQAGDRAGVDVSSAGDFNQDGFGDILIAAPGRSIVDDAGRTRLGLVYLVFGGTHLTNTTWNLDKVGTPDLPGIVFFSPYVTGRPNEAAPTTVAFIGDINADGFDDIAVGNPKADFIDPSFPQGPNAPGTDPATGRRSDVGDVYVIYGNNFGPNRLTP